ncbi:ATP-binding protein, partial [Roseivivax isoporae LMG 25204]
MERSQVLDAMGQLKLYGMKAAYDEIIATAGKRQHEPQKIVGDLLHAEISEKQARSIKYQMTIAKVPLAKEIDEFEFADTPVNETLVRDLAGGDFLEHQRNVVLIGGTVPSRGRHCASLHPQRRPRSVLQRGGPDEQARRRSSRRPAG